MKHAGFWSAARLPKILTIFRPDDLRGIQHA
jgi:hypothetical protein